MKTNAMKETERINKLEAENKALREFVEELADSGRSINCDCMDGCYIKAAQALLDSLGGWGKMRKIAIMIPCDEKHCGVCDLKRVESGVRCCLGFDGRIEGEFQELKEDENGLLRCAQCLAAEIEGE